MKKTILLMSLLSTAAFLSTKASAQSFELQNIRTGGVGCPSELTQVQLSTDSQSASIIFASFESKVPVLAGNKPAGKISTLNCNIFLDIKVPNGVKLDSLTVHNDMRGFAFFDRGVTGSFKSYLVSKNGLGTEGSNPRAQAPELITNKTWSNSGNSQEEDFSIRGSKTIAIPSQCSNGSNSGIVTIRLQNTLSSQILAGAGSQAQGSIIMDTSDISGGLKISATASACRAGRVPPSRDERTCREERVNNRIVKVCR
jgi:hypothetical protein